MKTAQRSIFWLLLGPVFAAIFTVNGVYAQSLNPNQTQGFSHGKLVKFTY